MDEKYDSHHTEPTEQRICSIEESKRNRIINAALTEFLVGYKKASTDNIVRAAGISKGLLFHYFGSKQGLYDHLIGYAIEIVQREFLGMINPQQTDILEAIWQMSLLKQDLSEQHPAIFDFLASVYLNSSEPTEKARLEEFMQMRASVMAQVFANADHSLFRADVEPERAIKIIMWSLDGWANSLKVEKTDSVRDNYQDYLDECQKFLDMFRKVFYR